MYDAAKKNLKKLFGTHLKTIFWYNNVYYLNVILKIEISAFTCENGHVGFIKISSLFKMSECVWVKKGPNTWPCVKYYLRTVQKCTKMETINVNLD